MEGMNQRQDLEFYANLREKVKSKPHKIAIVVEGDSQKLA